MRAPSASAVLWLAASCLPPLHPYVNEVYYDAAGDDTGQEFVELYNPADAPFPLNGLKLEAGDGAAPGRWTLRWTGAARDTIAPHARFVIGGAKVTPSPDAVVTLSLGNGPDAMRLRWPDGATQVVGWGALEYAEYFCGAPASDVAAGFSLARVPDGADRGSDSLDFRASEPSPGRANVVARDLAVLPGTLALAPDLPLPGAAVTVSVTLLARGTSAYAPGEGVLHCGGDALAAPLVQALSAITPGETLRVSLPGIAGADGARGLDVRVELAGDQRPSNDRDSLRVRIGHGPLEITEIQFHPALGEGEWIEVRASASDVDLRGFTLTDRGGTRAQVRDAAVLAHGTYALLAQDRAALLAAIPTLDAARVFAAAPWPNLNDRDGADGSADVLALRDSSELLSDRVAYDAAGVPAGVTLEKRDGRWQPAPGAPGTPLAGPSESPPGVVAFAVTPARIAAPGDALQVSWTLPWPTARVSIALFDVQGHRAATWLDAVPAGREERRDLRAIAPSPGVFIAVLRAEHAGATLTRTQPLRIVARGTP